jgi:2-methylcitrate dehydratase PrpD
MTPSSPAPRLPGSVGQGATRTLAGWAASVRPGDLPAPVRHHAHRLLVDYLGAAVAGSAAPLSGRLRRHLETTDPGDQATAILGSRLTAGAAAFVNGTSAHGLELDDGYTPGAVHPSATTLPAVLAAAEAGRLSADRVLTAIAVGVETTSRVAAAGHPATLHSGFHNTAVAGVFGATAATVNLLGGDAETMASALGLAGSHAGGLHEYQADGSEVKRLHAGKSARDGLACARLAVAGMPGPHTVLEGRHGYFAAFAGGDWRPEVLLEGLGDDWVSLRTYVKPYPCCRHLHGPIDAALAMRAAGLSDSRRIVGIAVSTFAIASRFDRAQPESFIQAQLSIPYAVAAALRLGALDVGAFGDDVRADEEIGRLAGLVRVTTDPELEARYPGQRPAVVTVTLEDGSELRHGVDQPLGEPDNPIDDAGLDAKFLGLTVPVLGRAHAERTLAAAWTLEDVTAVTAGLGVDHVSPTA